MSTSRLIAANNSFAIFHTIPFTKASASRFMRFWCPTCFGHWL
jgi:hypothetical protein